ncbi:MAG: metal-dependent hydrolase, partial [Thermoplasmata archaeon]
MANLLAHALAAMAFCGGLNALFGIPAISWGVFLAGFLAMLIELDLDDLSQNHRSPIGHSVFFGVIWIVIFSVVVCVIFPKEIALRGILAIISAYSTHLAIDVFTKEGIYVYPKGSKIKSWVTRLSKGDRVCWEYWIVF